MKETHRCLMLSLVSENSPLAITQIIKVTYVCSVRNIFDMYLAVAAGKGISQIYEDFIQLILGIAVFSHPGVQCAISAFQTWSTE